jgi:hypothetical protein
MPKQYQSQGKNEWSYLVEVDEVEDAPKTYQFSASDNERVDLARRLNVLSVEKANATITLQDIGGGVVHAIGMVRADVTQSCVVSLVPISEHIEDEFEGWFGDKAKSAVSFAKARSERDSKKGPAKGPVEAEIMEESVDPEPIVGGKVDIGELATQYLSLAINPYPHAPDAPREFTIGPKGAKTDGDGASLRKNPFEALKDWKEKR